MGIEELIANQQNALRREEIHQCLTALTSQFWDELHNVFRLIETELSDLKLSLYVSDTKKYGRIDLFGLGRAITISSPETIVREAGKKQITLRVLPPSEVYLKTEIKIHSPAVPIIFHVDSALVRHQSTLSEAASGIGTFAGFYRFLWSGQAENQRLAGSLVRIIRGEKPKSDFEFEPLDTMNRQGPSSREIILSIKSFWGDLTASAAIVAGILLVGAMLSWAILSSRSEMSEVCGDITWPLFVGKWENELLPSIVRQQPQESLHLLLYPGGEVVKGGQRGSWQIVTCEGPRILIDLPRRQQTDSCELQIDQIFDPERMTGTLSCAGSRLRVRRTEMRGLVSDGAVRIAQWKREENRYYEEEMAKASGWGRVLVWCRLKFLP